MVVSISLAVFRLGVVCYFCNQLVPHYELSSANSCVKCSYFIVQTCFNIVQFVTNRESMIDFFQIVLFLSLSSFLYCSSFHTFCFLNSFFRLFPLINSLIPSIYSPISPSSLPLMLPQFLLLVLRLLRLHKFLLVIPFLLFLLVIGDWGFTTLLTSQVISVAFYSEREKSDKFCSEALISA